MTTKSKSGLFSVRMFLYLFISHASIISHIKTPPSRSEIPNPQIIFISKNLNYPLMNDLVEGVGYYSRCAGAFEGGNEGPFDFFLDDYLDGNICGVSQG